MCQAIEELNRKVAEKAAEKAAHETALKVAKRLLELGILNDEKIAETCGLTVEEVKALNTLRTA